MSHEPTVNRTDPATDRGDPPDPVIAAKEAAVEWMKRRRLDAGFHSIPKLYDHFCAVARTRGIEVPRYRTFKSWVYGYRTIPYTYVMCLVETLGIRDPSEQVRAYQIIASIQNAARS